jgi:glycosyltransferase involved in cell wall biosynthesis
VLRDADVVVLPGCSSGVPFTLLEAMMTGCAIVAADCAAAREMLGETGLIVRPNDPAATAEAIVTLLKSPQARQTLGEQARERALQSYSEHVAVDEYRASYDRLMTGDSQAVDALDQIIEDALAAPAAAEASV